MTRVQPARVVLQRCRMASDEPRVRFKASNVRFSHRPVAHVSIGLALDEEILDHRAGAKQIESREKQFRVRRHALQDCIGECEPFVVRARRPVRFQERDEVAHQQGRVHRVGVARDGDDVERRRQTVSRAHDEARAQISARGSAGGEFEALIVQHPAIRSAI